jgi:hypothetical protein
MLSMEAVVSIGWYVVFELYCNVVQHDVFCGTVMFIKLKNLYEIE